MRVNKNRDFIDIFKGQDLLEFAERFKTDLACKEYLGEIKWKEGFTCRKCCNASHQVRKNFSRTCNKCGDTESPTANTIFHSVRFGVRKAFFICFEMAATTKSLSATQMGVRYGITEKTTRLFMLTWLLVKTILRMIMYRLTSHHFVLANVIPKFTQQQERRKSRTDELKHVQTSYKQFKTNFTK